MKIVPPQAPKTKNCLHLNTVTITDGSIYFSGGDIVDNTEDYLFCLDCLTRVEPQPVKTEEIEVPF